LSRRSLGERSEMGGATCPEGWDHDQGGVFCGRAQRAAAVIEGGSLVILFILAS